MNRQSVAFACLWALTTAMRNPAPAQDLRFIRGDADDDGALTVADALAGFQTIFLGRASSCHDAIDANDDDDLEVGDPVYILYHLFVDGRALAPPFPRCGLDTTADALDCRRAVVCDCLDESGMQALVAERTTSELCIPAPALETTILGNQIRACPPGSSTCSDGTDGCKLVFVDIDPVLDLVAADASIRLAGFVEHLFVDIDPLVGANQRCDLRVEFEGVVRGPLTLRPRPDGNFDFVQLGPANLDESLTTITFTSNIPATGFCQVLLNLQASLVNSIITEIQPSIDDVATDLNRDLQGTVVCREGR